MGVHVFPILNPSSNLPPYTIPLGHPSAPAPSILYPASNLDWQFISYMILYMFQCHSPNHRPLPLPQSPKDCSIYLWLFYCLTYRVIVTIFLNSIYMHSVQFSSVTQSCLTLPPHELQHARPPCPSPTPGVHFLYKWKWCHFSVSFRFVL